MKQSVRPVEVNPMRKNNKRVPFRVRWIRGLSYGYKYFETRAEADDWFRWAQQEIEVEQPPNVTFRIDQPNQPYKATIERGGERFSSSFANLNEARAWLATFR